MSAKGCRLSYSAGGHASPTRPLEVLLKSVVVRRPPWIFRLRTDKNNLESPFEKFERYFGSRNVGFTALLMLIIFHSLHFPLSLQITTGPDLFSCDLYDMYVTSRCITYSRVFDNCFFNCCKVFEREREKVLDRYRYFSIVLYYFIFPL